jgi:hypothetical protein
MSEFDRHRLLVERALSVQRTFVFVLSVLAVSLGLAIMLLTDGASFGAWALRGLAGMFALGGLTGFGLMWSELRPGRAPLLRLMLSSPQRIVWIYEKGKYQLGPLRTLVVALDNNEELELLVQKTKLEATIGAIQAFAPHAILGHQRSQ